MKKLSALGTSLALLALQARDVFAQEAEDTLSQEINIEKPPAFKIGEFGSIVSGLAQLFLIVAAILAFLYLLWGGISWITSGGDKANTEAARNRITAALIGLAIVASAYAIINLAEQVLGFDFFEGTTNIPTLF